jgi:NCS1 family nucleobase:cation symporter-1
MLCRSVDYLWSAAVDRGSFGQPGMLIERARSQAGPQVQYWWCVYSGHRISPMSEKLKENLEKAPCNRADRK